MLCFPGHRVQGNRFTHQLRPGTCTVLVERIRRTNSVEGKVVYSHYETKVLYTSQVVQYCLLSAVSLSVGLYQGNLLHQQSIYGNGHLKFNKVISSKQGIVSSRAPFSESVLIFLGVTVSHIDWNVGECCSAQSRTRVLQSLLALQLACHVQPAQRQSQKPWESCMPPRAAITINSLLEYCSHNGIVLSDFSYKSPAISIAGSFLSVLALYAESKKLMILNFHNIESHLKQSLEHSASWYLKLSELHEKRSLLFF